MKTLLKEFTEEEKKAFIDKIKAEKQKQVIDQKIVKK